MTNSYQKYIILSTPRSGSQLLVYYLHGHPTIRSYSELFQPNFIFVNPEKTIFENQFFLRVYRHLRHRVPIFILRRVIFTLYPRHISAVGFKLFYDHAQTDSLKSVWTYLQKEPGLKIIHLKRKNLLRSLVSHRIADKTNTFMKFDSAPAKNNRLTLTPDECVSYFTNIENKQKDFDSFFSSKEILQLNYEQLIDSPNRELNRVQKFLGVSQHILSSPLKQQGTISLKYTISNYTALKTYFTHTRWVEFFA